MAAGDRIFMAKESTSQEILSNTKKIIEDAKAKPKRRPAAGVSDNSAATPIYTQNWQIYYGCGINRLVFLISFTFPGSRIWL